MERGRGERTGRPLALVLFLSCHEGEKAHQNSLPSVIQCPNRPVVVGLAGGTLDICIERIGLPQTKFMDGSSCGLGVRFGYMCCLALFFFFGISEFS